MKQNHVTKPNETTSLRSPLGSEGVSISLDSSTTKEEIIETVYDKVILSGRYTEHYNYEHGIRIGDTRKKKRKMRKRDKTKETSDESRRRSNISAANKLRRILNLNFGQESKFVTLTFRDTEEIDINNVKECNYEFKKFIQRLKYKFAEIKYVSVIEFQKRGAVHYHIVINSEYIRHEELESIWGLGFVFIQNLGSISKIGHYMSKYMLKSKFDKRLKGEKCYFTSKNLLKPQVIYGDKAKEIINSLSAEPSFTNSFDSFMSGKVKYSDYWDKDISVSSKQDDN